MPVMAMPARAVGSIPACPAPDFEHRPVAGLRGFHKKSHILASLIWHHVVVEFGVAA